MLTELSGNIFIILHTGNSWLNFRWTFLSYYIQGNIDWTFGKHFIILRTGNCWLNFRWTFLSFKHREMLTELSVSIFIISSRRNGAREVFFLNAYDRKFWQLRHGLTGLTQPSNFCEPYIWVAMKVVIWNKNKQMLTFQNRKLYNFEAIDRT